MATVSTQMKEENNEIDDTTTMTSPEDEYPTSFQLAMIVVALILSMFLASLDMTILSSAIPRITSDFNSLDDIGWYASAFFLTVASSQSSWGKAYKYFSLKITFLTAIFLFELGSLVCGVSPNSTALIVGRAITGIGAAGVLAGCYTIIALSVPPLKRPAFAGVLGATYGVASVIGPLLGGVFTDKLTWRWCFYINLPIGGVSTFIILMVFKSPKAPLTAQTTLREKILQMDIPGAFVIMAAVVCYVLAMQDAGITKAWSSSKIIGLLVGFVLLIGLFIVVEIFQKDRALVLGRLMNDRTMLIGCTFMFFLGGAWFILLYYLPIYFQSIQDVTAENSGIRNLPMIISMTLTTIAAGVFLSTAGVFAPLLILGSAIGTIGSGLLYTLNIGSPTSHWIGFQIVVGIGFGLCFQAPVMVGQALSEPEDISTVTAILLFFQTLGGAFLVSAAESAFVNTLVKQLKYNAVGINPQSVIDTGATGLRQAFTATELSGILLSYMAALKVAYSIAIAAAGVATLVGLFSSWKNIKGKAIISTV